jgi:hypothetical protein
VRLIGRAFSLGKTAVRGLSFGWEKVQGARCKVQGSRYKVQGARKAGGGGVRGMSFGWEKQFVEKRSLVASEGAPAAALG